MNNELILRQITTEYLTAISQTRLSEPNARHFMFRYAMSIPQTFQRVDFASLALPITNNELSNLANDNQPLTPLTLYDYLRTGFYADFLKIHQRKLSKNIVELILRDGIDSNLLTTKTYKVICAVYYAFYQGYCDLRTELRRKFEAIPTKDFTGDNYYYGITHFVICDSNFYLLAPRRSSWVLDSLKESVSSILSTNKLDLIAEAQLTAKLLGSELFTGSEFSNMIMEHYDEKAGYFKQSIDRGIDSSEHTNSLIMMILAQEEFDWISKLT